MTKESKLPGEASFPYGKDAISLAKADAAHPPLRHFSLDHRTTVSTEIIRQFSNRITTLLGYGERAFESYSDPIRHFESIFALNMSAEMRVEIEAARSRILPILEQAVSREASDIKANPSVEQIVRWKLIPALHAMASDLSGDISSLKQITDTFPVEFREQFLASIEGSYFPQDVSLHRSSVACLFGRKQTHFEDEEVSAYLSAFNKLMNAINNGFLHTQRLHLVSNNGFWSELAGNPRGYKPDMDPVWMSRFCGHIKEECGGLPLTITILHDLPPSTKGNSAIHYNPDAETVIFTERSLIDEMRMFAAFLRLRKKFTGNPKSIPADEAQLRRLSDIFRIKSAEDAAWYLSERSLIEELRHHVDDMRLKGAFPDMKTEKEKWNIYFRHFLASGSFLQSAVAAMEDDQERNFWQNVCTELSAHVTVTATSELPSLMLNEWQWYLERSLADEYETRPHTFAAQYGSLLIGSRLGICDMPVFKSEKHPMDIDEPAFHESIRIIETLRSVPVEQLRLAAKGAWRNEFAMGVVDEEPFMRVTPHGELEFQPKTIKLDLPDDLKKYFDKPLRDL